MSVRAILIGAIQRLAKWIACVAGRDSVQPMTIACLGWGSLIWDPRELPTTGEWFSDGPALPLEFARVSGGERVTLVITSGEDRCNVLWSSLKDADLASAVAALAKREGIRGARQIEDWIGRWPKDSGREYACADTIAAWATANGLAGVVWTALPPGRKSDRGNMMSLPEVLHHLRSLNGEIWKDAVDYILRTPRQIATPYRPALEAEIADRNVGTR